MFYARHADMAQCGAAREQTMLFAAMFTPYQNNRRTRMYAIRCCHDSTVTHNNTTTLNERRIQEYYVTPWSVATANRIRTHHAVAMLITRAIIMARMPRCRSRQCADTAMRRRCRCDALRGVPPARARRATLMIIITPRDIGDIDHTRHNCSLAEGDRQILPGAAIAVTRC